MSICNECFFFKGSKSTKIGKCYKKEIELHEKTTTCVFYRDRKQVKISLDLYIDTLKNWINGKTKSYVVFFDEWESIQLDIVQGFSRPNNPTDYDIIVEYVKDNFLTSGYDIIELDTIEKIRL
ncbi:hypothetical protein [Clostridioides difficile]|uniref:hypothetical protein n=1 Tax=Clostridioides difficile TaxID=1496 RepID=UPI00103420FD|nr:hypothetical protein [Clostridioides difficile]MDM9944036.1 hypothetical protein [Clostridioides difficile]